MSAFQPLQTLPARFALLLRAKENIRGALNVHSARSTRMFKVIGGIVLVVFIIGLLVITGILKAIF